MILNKIDTFKKTISHKFEKYNFLNVSICVYYILKNKKIHSLRAAAGERLLRIKEKRGIMHCLKRAYWEWN